MVVENRPRGSPAEVLPVQRLDRWDSLCLPISTRARSIGTVGYRARASERNADLTAPDRRSWAPGGSCASPSSRGSRTFHQRQRQAASRPNDPRRRRSHHDPACGPGGLTQRVIGSCSRPDRLSMVPAHIARAHWLRHDIPMLGPLRPTNLTFRTSR